MTERIQKALATAGVASRRTIEEWIAEGRITVNGRPAELGQKVGHDDHVRVDGRAIGLARKPAPTQVLLFRKKTGELVTREDPEGRRTVFRKLPALEAGRWIAVGRLDINTSGLLLLTNDGELARRLTHPSFGIRRVYAVRVLGDVNAEIQRRLKAGVELDDGLSRCESLVAVSAPEADEEESPGGANRWYEVTLAEGRNRIVRRLFESQGLQVSRLIRISYGPIQLGRGIKAGSYREATAEELNALLQAVGLSAAVPAHAPKRSAARRPRGEGESRGSAMTEAPKKKHPQKPKAAARAGKPDRARAATDAARERPPAKNPRPGGRPARPEGGSSRPAKSAPGRSKPNRPAPKGRTRKPK